MTTYNERADFVARLAKSDRDFGTDFVAQDVRAVVKNHPVFADQYRYYSNPEEYELYAIWFSVAIHLTETDMTNVLSLAKKAERVRIGSLQTVRAAMAVAQRRYKYAEEPMQFLLAWNGRVVDWPEED